MEIVGHIINGSDVKEQNCRTQNVFNPATGDITKQVSLASKTTVRQAITAADKAFIEWRNTPAIKRVKIMFRFKELLETNADNICHIITNEHGKVFDDALGELIRGIEVVEFACGAPQLLKGEHSKNVGPAIDSWSEFQPLGVVAGITPFNFPAMVPMWMFPLAIVCGNTFVLKPSERNPSAPMLIGALLKEAGLPDGVFNIVNGDKEAVNAILEDSRVQAVSFVGSTPIAEYIYHKGTANAKRVQALGGAKNHAIIMPDADLDNAANALMGAAYGSCGERCMAISVVVCIGDNTADELIKKLKPQVEALKIGNGVDSNNDMGPVITKDAQERIKSLISQGIEEGAKLIVDGRSLVVENHESGYFVGGTLFDNVTQEMIIYQQEIFGPVLCIMRVDSMQEAMQMIDNHEFGNGACLFTRDGEAARYFSDNIKVGMVGINVPLPVPAAYHSFGGWKRSLFGDLSAHGPDGIRFYTRRKTVTQRWPSSGVREGKQFSFPS